MSFTVLSYNATVLLIQPNPTQPITCAGKCDPTQPNPTHGWTQPMSISERDRLIVCMSASIAPKLLVQSTKILCAVTYGGFSLCTSGFVDDVMFAHYSQEYATRERHILKLTHQGASPERGRSLLCAIALLQTASCAVTAVGLRRTTKNKTFGDNSYVSSSPSPSSVNIKGNIRGISLSLVHRNAIVFTTSLLISNLRGT